MKTNVAVTASSALLSFSLLQADSLYIESDPFAYMLNGYSLHLGYEGESLRAQFGIFGVNQPKEVLSNKNFSLYQHGYGLKIDYFGSDPSGWFIGVEVEKTQIIYKLDATQSASSRDANLLGLRSGYKYTFEPWYVMPWIAVKYNISDTGDTYVDSQYYKNTMVLLFPTIHLGYQF